MTNDYRIRFGTVGWQHPQWSDNFYPEDLPEDWLLSFYGNEFPVVAVPSSIWSDDPAEQIEEWLENSDEHFQFVFEWPWQGADDLRAFCQRIEPMRAQSLGILLQVPWSVCCQDNDLPSILAEISTTVPVCLEVMADDTGLPMTTLDFAHAEFKALLTTAQVNCCWHGAEANHEAFFTEGKLAVTKITNTAMDARQLRQVLETCSAQVQSHNDMVFLFAGNPPALKQVRDAMVMLELLA